MRANELLAVRGLGSPLTPVSLGEAVRRWPDAWGVFCAAARGGGMRPAVLPDGRCLEVFGLGMPAAATPPGGGTGGAVVPLRPRVAG